MLTPVGLSLEQAPPIEVPFAFFMAAPVLAMAAGGILAWQGDIVILSRWSAPALAITHLLALGWLTQVICGALLQMLPVLAGSPVPRVVLVGRSTQLFLVVGCIALSWGLYGGARTSLMAGGAALTLGVLVLAIAVGLALLRARGVPHTVGAMRLAVAALAVTLMLGLLLLLGLLGVPVPRLTAWVDLHLQWGLLGWAGLLIMGVGYQVVPMFHVTPGYPAWLTRAAAPLVLGGLLLASLGAVLGWSGLARWALLLSVAAFVLFALATLDLQRRRERPRADVTLLYWRASMLLIVAAAVLWMLGASAELLGAILVAVAIGLPTGMLFKIMPFLAWFHLQHRQVALKRFDIRLPHMQAFIPEHLARAQLGVYLAFALLLIASAASPTDAWAGVCGRLAGVCLVAAAGVLLWLQAQCYLRHRGVKRELG